jgi:hypothetical protein
MERNAVSISEHVILALVANGFFYVDDDGCIWRLQSFGRTGRVRHVAPRRADELRKSGYLQVRVQIGGINYVALSHRIVWLLEHGEIPDGLQINHENGKKGDNRLLNLSVVTPSENTLHSWISLGRPPTAGESNGRAKLTKSDVERIRQLYAAGGSSHRNLAKRFGVSHRQIGYIVTGQRWSEFPA